MKREDALRILWAAPDKRVKYRGSKFGDRLRSEFCREAIIQMDGDFMVVTDLGQLFLNNYFQKKN